MGAMYPHCPVCSGMCEDRAKDFAERRKKELESKKLPEGYPVSFYKRNSKWYADIPNHTEEENEMVCGADIMLEELSGGKDEIKVLITFEKLPNSNPICFYLKEHDDNGAWYYVTANEKEYGEVWICNVTHDVLGEHPQEFYVMVLNVNEETNAELDKYFREKIAKNEVDKLTEEFGKYDPWSDPVEAVDLANQMAADDIINDCLRKMELNDGNKI